MKCFLLAAFVFKADILTAADILSFVPQFINLLLTPRPAKLAWNFQFCFILGSKSFQLKALYLISMKRQESRKETLYKIDSQVLGNVKPIFKVRQFEELVLTAQDIRLNQLTIGLISKDLS